MSHGRNDIRSQCKLALVLKVRSQCADNRVVARDGEKAYPAFSGGDETVPSAIIGMFAEHFDATGRVKSDRLGLSIKTAVQQGPCRPGELFGLGSRRGSMQSAFNQTLDQTIFVQECFDPRGSQR